MALIRLRAPAFAAAAAASIALSPTLTHATIIGFDDVPGGTILTNQYPEVTFSSSSGNQNSAIAISAATTPPNVLCSGPIGGPVNCTDDTYLDFTAPVNGLTFWAIEANAVGITATFNIYQNGTLTTAVDFISTGGSPHNQLVDLSAFTNITRLEIVGILNDPGTENGIAWDTFEFTAVPAPGSLGLTLLLPLAACRRRP